MRGKRVFVEAEKGGCMWGSGGVRVKNGKEATSGSARQPVAKLDQAKLR